MWSPEELLGLCECEAKQGADRCAGSPIDRGLGFDWLDLLAIGEQPVRHSDSFLLQLLTCLHTIPLCSFGSRERLPCRARGVPPGDAGQALPPSCILLGQGLHWYHLAILIPLVGGRHQLSIHWLEWRKGRSNSLVLCHHGGLLQLWGRGGFHGLRRRVQPEPRSLDCTWPYHAAASPIGHFHQGRI